jgi:HSP20 family protein
MNLIPRDFFLDDVFSDFLTSKDTNHLKCDIYEKGNKYFIEMDMPGFKKEDAKIECDNGYITIKVSKNDEKIDESKNYIKKERYFNEYQRSFYVGDIDTNDIKASFKDGVVLVEVPKEEKTSTRKVIEIQ